MSATACRHLRHPDSSEQLLDDADEANTGAFASAGVAGILGVVLAWTKAGSWRG